MKIWVRGVVRVQSNMFRGSLVTGSGQERGKMGGWVRDSVYANMLQK